MVISHLSELNSSLSKNLSREHLLMTSSGSAALITALLASKIPKGSDVIMPAICCPAVLFAIQLAGFTPVLADVSLDDYCMNVPQVEAVKTENTVAIVAVHSYGHYCKIDELEIYAKQNSLVLIEDACLAMGGTYKGKPLGSFGDISIISFGYDKTINCNYGGLLTTNNHTFYSNALNIINNNEFFAFTPSQSQINELNVKLSQLVSFISKRQKNTKTCHSLLKNKNIKKLPYNDDITYWRYPLLIKNNRDELVKKAQSHGITITTHYKSLAQLSTGVHLENAHYISEHIVNIFIRPETPQSQLLNIINFINEHAQ